MQKMLSVNCAECRFTNAGFQAQASLLLVRVEYLGGKVLSETGVKNKGKSLKELNVLSDCLSVHSSQVRSTGHCSHRIVTQHVYL